MNQLVDVEAIYREERQRWLLEEAPKKSPREVIAQSIPYGIVVVAVVLYGLSAPHTASVFDKLTPGWGWIALCCLLPTPGPAQPGNRFLDIVGAGNPVVSDRYVSQWGRRVFVSG